MKPPHLLLVILVCCFSRLTSRAQIFEQKEVNGKQVSCLHSGLFSDLQDCSARSRWYAYAFVGRITAVTVSGESEFDLDVVPEEVFHGDPGNLLKVHTAQGLCLPELKVGDRWLFFLRKEAHKPITLDFYGNDSKPVESAAREVETLRTLQHIGNRGLLRGSVNSGRDFMSGEPIPNARVVARHQGDNLEYTAVTDSNGRYDFQPLPSGRYGLTVDPVGSFIADPSSQEIKPGECWDLTLSRTPHTLLSGQVLYSDGSPARNAAVILFDDDNEGYNIRHTDDQGRFSFETLTAGGYIVGVNPPGAPPWKYGSAGGAGIELPPAQWFFPNAHDRAAAQVIKLDRDQRREDIDFVIPSP